MIAIQFVLFYGMLAILGAFLGFCMFLAMIKLVRAVALRIGLRDWNDPNILKRYIVRVTYVVLFKQPKGYNGQPLGYEKGFDYNYEDQYRFENFLLPFIGTIAWLLILCVAFIWAANGVEQYYSGGM